MGLILMAIAAGMVTIIVIAAIGDSAASLVGSTCPRADGYLMLLTDETGRARVIDGYLAAAELMALFGFFGGAGTYYYMRQNRTSSTYSRTTGRNIPQLVLLFFIVVFTIGAMGTGGYMRST